MSTSMLHDMMCNVDDPHCRWVDVCTSRAVYNVVQYILLIRVSLLLTGLCCR